MKPLHLSMVVLLLWTSLAGAQVAIIANKSVPVDDIDRHVLLDLYTGDYRVWNTGEPVVLMDLKEKGAIKDAFYAFLGRSSSRMKSVWMKNLLSGEGAPPESCESEDQLLTRVASTPGAVGYISQSKVTGDVMTLLVIPRSKN